MILREQYPVILVLLSAISLSSSEYSRGLKVGTIPEDGTVGLVSSRADRNRLYTLRGTKVISLDKRSGATKAIIPAYSRDNAGSPWGGLAVGPCGHSGDCVYLVKKSATGVQLLRLAEPETNESISDISAEEHLTVELPSLTSKRGDPLILVDKKGDAILICKEDGKYVSYKVSNSLWSNGSSAQKITSARTEINIKHIKTIKSVEWNLLSNKVLVQSSTEDVFIFNVHNGDQTIVEILEGKPHHVKLRRPKELKLHAISWGTTASKIYSIVRGKQLALFVFNLELSSIDYQNDEAGGRRRQSRYRQCEDKNENCPRWATNGMCQNRKSYMMVTCPKSCQTCGESERMKGVSTCLDGSHMCTVWAEQGKCTHGSSRNYMRQNCKKSCQVCSSPSSTTSVCRDMHQYCVGWAGAGRCESRPDYMLTNCQASCNRCKTVADAKKSFPNDQAESTASNCKDRSEHCSSWAADGKCEIRKDYMFVNCPNSCGLCGRKKHSKGELHSEAKCEDKNKYCLVWEARGYCKAKRKYMAKNCAAACNTCRRSKGSASVSSTCADRHDFCKTWSKYKMCTLKPAYMKENCAQSCGKCKSSGDSYISSNRILDGTAKRGQTNTTSNRVTDNSERSNSKKIVDGSAKRVQPKRPVKAEATVPVQPSDCQDKSGHCQVWAKAGYCTIKQDYMIVYCQRTCKLCKKGAKVVTDKPTPRKYTNNLQESKARRTELIREKKSCKDTKVHCKVWAGAGLCETRASIMNILCPLSCNICTQETTQAIVQTTPTPVTTQSSQENDCKDESKLCSVWEAAGRCETRISYMRLNCAKTCRLCPGVQYDNTPKCEDKNDFCPAWAHSNRCRMYLGYMKTNCAKSCKLCIPKSDRSDCLDGNKFCSRWAEKGYCKIRPDFMGRVCKKSCQSCG